MRNFRQMKANHPKTEFPLCISNFYDLLIVCALRKILFKEFSNETNHKMVERNEFLHYTLSLSLVALTSCNQPANNSGSSGGATVNPEEQKANLIRTLSNAELHNVATAIYQSLTNDEKNKIINLPLSDDIKDKLQNNKLNELSADEVKTLLEKVKKVVPEKKINTALIEANGGANAEAKEGFWYYCENSKPTDPHLIYYGGSDKKTIQEILKIAKQEKHNEETGLPIPGKYNYILQSARHGSGYNDLKTACAFDTLKAKTDAKFFYLQTGFFAPREGWYVLNYTEYGETNYLFFEKQKIPPTKTCEVVKYNGTLYAPVVVFNNDREDEKYDFCIYIMPADKQYSDAQTLAERVNSSYQFDFDDALKPAREPKWSTTEEMYGRWLTDSNKWTSDRKPQQKTGGETESYYVVLVKNNGKAYEDFEFFSQTGKQTTPYPQDKIQNYRQGITGKTASTASYFEIPWDASKHDYNTVINAIADNWASQNYTHWFEITENEIKEMETNENYFQLGCLPVVPRNWEN